MTTNREPIGTRVKLWQLISPTLPVGAFHYSQGLEAAVVRGWVHDEATAASWIHGILHHTMTSVDLPILVRTHRAWQARDAARLTHWDRICRANRETRELREEERNMGLALRRLTVELGEPVPDSPFGFVTTYGIIAANWGLTASDAAAGYAWSWGEHQVASAVKLVPLGQTAGQRILLHLGASLATAVDRALDCSDEEIGRGAPGLAIASCLHEVQYSKLFRS